MVSIAGIACCPVAHPGGDLSEGQPFLFHPGYALSSCLIVNRFAGEEFLGLTGDGDVARPDLDPLGRILVLYQV